MPIFTLSEDLNDVERIQEEIQNRICFLEYPAGTILKETALAKEFGVSRTPMREALNRLRYLGLIETRNGVGTVVIELSLEKLTQIYQMRMELASLIGTLTPNSITQEHEVLAQDLLKRSELLLKKFNTVEYFTINQELNALILNIIGNVSLREIWQQLYIQSASSWYRVTIKTPQEVTKFLIEELSDLLIAIEARDAELVGLNQRIHIKYGFQRIKKYNNGLS